MKDLMATQKDKILNLYNPEYLIQDFKRALLNDEFVVYFQPVYDIKSEQPYILSCEALVRWIHPIYGLIMPADFIPLFEQNGLIGELDYYIWNESAKQLAQWKKKYNTPISVSVNISRIDIQEDSFEDKLLKIIEVNNVEINDFHLEVTESAYVEDAEKIVMVINKLYSQGFKIEVDDFGAGYSPLKMLYSISADVIKIDRKVIIGLSENKDKALSFIEEIHNIAVTLKGQLLAEGVETEEEVKILKDAGCDMIQGYYFSKPLTALEFEKLLKQ